MHSIVSGNRVSSLPNRKSHATPTSLGYFVSITLYRMNLSVVDILSLLQARLIRTYPVILVSEVAEYYAIMNGKALYEKHMC
jgi:hypothetical protein